MRDTPDPARMRRDYTAHDHTAHDHTAHDHTAHDHTAHDQTAHDTVPSGGVDVGLSEADLAADWHTQFGRWFAEAVAARLPEPNAMIVATAAADARPSARTVLLKGFDETGLMFFTNYSSRKGAEALTNPYASAVFPWFPMRRQVVICGRVEAVPRVDTEAYFALRPRTAQLAAWASPQSQVIADRAELERAWAELDRRFGPDEVPPPPNWGGLRIVPDTVEFWQGREGRLHDRLRYRRSDGEWVVERLAP